MSNLPKPGDKRVAECGCVFEFGHGITPRPATSGCDQIERPIYDIITTRCKRCEEYIRRRNELIPEALELAKHKKNKDIAFLAHMDRLAKERGI